MFIISGFCCFTTVLKVAHFHALRFLLVYLTEIKLFENRYNKPFRRISHYNYLFIPYTMYLKVLV